jgi:predicted ArsR family transcriptional regulator
VLAQAGLASGGWAAAGQSSTKRTAGSAVSVDQVKAAVRTVRGTFHMADIARAAGGSPMTIRKALKELTTEGSIRRIGPDPGWSARGRAPTLYERA